MIFTKNTVFNALLAGCLIFGLSGCKENSLIFPEDVELESPEDSERGPVKQNHLRVILDDDEKVKFVISDVDVERVKSIFFSHNIDGEVARTEVSDFDDYYVISNLPLDVETDINVWAIGINNLESKVATYSVKPLPYSAKVIADLLTAQGGVMSATISVYNTTKTNATLFYKMNDAATYTMQELPSPTTGLEVLLEGLSEGQHILSYYVTDEKGGVTDVLTKTLEVKPPTLISFTTPESKELWTVTVSSNQANDGQGGPGLIDGNPETFWHTPWSGDLPAWPHEATIDFGEFITLTKFIFLNRHNNGGNAPKDIDLQVSYDGVNYTTYQSFFNESTANGATVSFDISTPITTRFVRISTRTGYHGSWVNYGEISFEGYR